MDKVNDRWSETITAREAYLAMVEFVWNYWRNGGKLEKDVEFMAAHICNGAPPGNNDLSLETEWFEAIDKARD